MDVIATYFSVICFVLVPMASSRLARANGLSQSAAWLLAFGPILIGFVAYFLASHLNGNSLDWSFLGSLMIAFIFVTNFWQAHKLARKVSL